MNSEIVFAVRMSLLFVSSWIVTVSRIISSTSQFLWCLWGHLSHTSIYYYYFEWAILCRRCVCWFSAFVCDASPQLIIFVSFSGSTKQFAWRPLAVIERMFRSTIFHGNTWYRYRFSNVTINLSAEHIGNWLRYRAVLWARFTDK